MLQFYVEKKNQQRILENGEELLEGLSKILKPNILVRLVDTGQLDIETQIALMRKTDYFIWPHGSGGTLSMFLKDNSIDHEVYHVFGNTRVLLIGAMNGHKTYSSKISSIVTKKENEMIHLDLNNFINNVLFKMNESNFI